MVCNEWGWGENLEKGSQGKNPVFKRRKCYILLLFAFKWQNLDTKKISDSIIDL